MVLTSAEFETNLERGEELLWKNGYPGRWAAIGRGDGEFSDEYYLGYSFGGRSEGSKNRKAVPEDNAVRLVAPGMSAEEMAEKPDSALVFYHSSDARDGVFVVSNGGQTRYVLDAVVDGASFEEAVTTAPIVKGMMNGEEVEIDLSSYEPDKPINTPRITGILDCRPETAASLGLAVVRKNFDTGEPIRKFYTANLHDLKPGQGWAIQTYGVNDPNDRVTPVPHFSEDPYGFYMGGGATAIAGRVREAIGERTFASSVVRAIDLARGEFNGDPVIINTRG